MKPAVRSGRVLYFTKGSAVTAEDRDAGYAIVHNVAFRNASMPIGDILEDCDAVAGYPPPRYAKAYFTVKTPAELKAAVEARIAGIMPEFEEDSEALPDVHDLGSGSGTKPEDASPPEKPAKSHKGSAKVAKANTPQKPAAATVPKWGANS